METKAGFADKYFLEKVYLSGYKSIRQTEVEFKNNLSIIIGKNGSGKTNFLSFLDRILNKNLDGIFDYNSSLKFEGAVNIELITESNLSEAIERKKFVLDDELLFTLIINGETVKYRANEYSILLKKLQEEDFLPSSTLIKHGRPEEYNIVDKPFSFTIDNQGKPSSLLHSISSERPYFVSSLLAAFFFDINNDERLSGWIEISLEEVKQHLKDYLFGLIDNIVLDAQKLTPISNVRLSNDFNVTSNEQKVKISNLFMEFEISDSWYSFSDLSDGTKRLFYIISEVAFTEVFFFRSELFGIGGDGYSRIILIEEPELGIHPHQLRKLMLFLKEQSKTKQIIITTHSPEVLDILEPDELDSIILCSYEKEKGTLLRHLTDTEKEKAQAYIKEDFLSDYWMHSNLEPAN